MKIYLDKPEGASGLNYARIVDHTLANRLERCLEKTGCTFDERTGAWLTPTQDED